MGSAADLVLDGILAWDGSYNGTDRYYSSYGGSGTRLLHVEKVLALIKLRGVKKAPRRFELIMEYGKVIDRPNASAICRVICEDKPSWRIFRKWLDEQVGYGKPSKQ